MLLTAEDRARESSRTVTRAVVALLVAWVGYRFLYTLELPALFGWDPYIRAIHRDEVVVSFFGRRWPPLLQLLVVGITRAGGDLWALRAVLAAAGALLLVGAFFLVRRQGGFFAGAVAVLLLSTSADVLLPSATLYQESLFYPLLMLIAWRLVPDWKGESLPLLAVLVFLATTCRYEGLLVGLALVSVVMARAGMRRALWSTPVLVLPSVVFYVAYTRFQDDEHSALSRGLLLESVEQNALYLLDYLSRMEVLPTLAVAAVGWWLQRGRRGAAFGMLDAYILLFAVTYVFVQPFYPADNRRFHVPFVVWMHLYAALALARLSQLSRERSPRLFAFLLVALLGYAATQWQAVDDDLRHLSSPHRTDAALGQRIGRLTEARRIVTPIAPLDERLRPSERFLAFVRGPASRLHHDPSLASVTPDDAVLVRSGDAPETDFESLLRDKGARRRIELEAGLRLYLPLGADSRP